MTKPIWKKIPGYPGNEVSEVGDARRAELLLRLKDHTTLKLVRETQKE